MSYRCHVYNHTSLLQLYIRLLSSNISECCVCICSCMRVCRNACVCQLFLLPLIWSVINWFILQFKSIINISILKRMYHIMRYKNISMKPCVISSVKHLLSKLRWTLFCFVDFIKYKYLTSSLYKYDMHVMIFTT